MKRFIVCIVFITCLSIFSGCEEEMINQNDTTQFLTETEHWYFYNEVTGESEMMGFSEDLSFYWGCECGRHLEDADRYDRYDYNKDAQIITLYNDFEHTALDVKILDYSQYHLLLEFQGEVKDYTSMDSEMDVEDSETYLKDYNMYGSFIEGSKEEVVVGPFNYDGDVTYPENAMKTYPLADDVKFHDLKITKRVTDDGKTATVVYDELEQEEGVKLLPGGYGFIWFNDDMEIEKITYYGQTEIWE